MTVDKVESPQTAIIPFAKGIVHYGETTQHLHIVIFCIIMIIMIPFSIGAQQQKHNHHSPRAPFIPVKHLIS